MEKIRQVVEGKALSQIIDLPESFQNILVEITVTPLITRDDLRAQLRGSHTEYLSGVLKKQSDIDDIEINDADIEKLREERRKKYECAD